MAQTEPEGMILTATMGMTYFMVILMLAWLVFRASIVDDDDMKENENS